MHTFNGHGQFIEFVGDGKVKLITSPDGEEEQTDENTDAESDNDSEQAITA